MATNPVNKAAALSFVFCCLPIFCMALAVAPAAKGAVEIEPSVAVGVAHTDNVMLDTAGEESETVYQVLPGIDVIHESSRFSANAAYRLHGYYYSDRSDSQVYHLLDGQTRTVLDPDNLFFDLGASRNQSIRDPEAAVPFSTLPINGNRIERDTLYAGPVLQYAVGANATANGRYQRRWTRYDRGADLDDIGREADEDTYVDFSIDNYRVERGLTWAARYNSQKTEYGLGSSWEYRRGVLELGGWVTRGFRLFASGGKESPWDQPLDASLEDTFWEAGFANHAGDQFRAEFAVGERSFGSSRRGLLELNVRRANTQLSYVEQPTTQGRSPFREEGLAALGELEDFLTRPGAVERYISKRLEWNLHFELRRTDLSFAAFDELREQRSRIDGTPLGDQMQRGVSFDALFHAGTRTDLLFTMRRVQREFSTGVDREYRVASIGANHRLGRLTGLSAVYMHSQDKERLENVGDSYKANIIIVFLTREFDL